MKNKIAVGIKYIETNIVHLNKNNKEICGDVSMCKRSSDSTTFILCDGIGSGIKANIAATMCVSRIYKSIEMGMSLFKICENIVSSMHLARTQDIPFAAFTIVRILNNGQFKVFTYEMPLPVIIENSYSYKIEPRYFKIGHEIMAETNGILNNDDKLMLVSDGVCQAGMGNKYALGITLEGIIAYANRLLRKQIAINVFMDKLIEKVLMISENRLGDDTSIAILKCRRAKIMNIMTGPPREKSRDSLMVEDFLNADGLKVICGSSTADIVSRITGKNVSVDKMPSFIAESPTYKMEGIDIVTEGALTLNQLYNLMNNEICDYNTKSCVLDILKGLKNSDIINFFVGNSINESHNTLPFRQLGIVPRKKIIKKIQKKLDEIGKLTIVKNY